MSPEELESDANFICVAEDFGKVVRVYDQLDEVEEMEFWYEDYDNDKLRARLEAERYAKAEARRLGCSWGTNY